MDGIQTRAQFVKTLGCGVIALSLGGIAAAVAAKPAKFVRIVPIAGLSYSPAFLELCRSHRFESVRHALRSVRDPELEFDLEFSERADS